MDIANLTSTEGIRALLGASAEDLSDEDIKNFDLPTELSVHLSSWLPDYLTIKADGLSQGATDAQKDAYTKLTLYAKYFGAYTVGMSANFSMAQQISDGENELQRFQDNRWKDLMAKIRNRMAEYRRMLTDYAKDTFGRSVEVTTYSLFGKATPSFDPVTGEET